MKIARYSHLCIIGIFSLLISGKRKAPANAPGKKENEMTPQGRKKKLTKSAEGAQKDDKNEGDDDADTPYGDPNVHRQVVKSQAECKKKKGQLTET